jgi:2-iminobutanoate/2-iminopropanoate deaminase
MTRRIVTLPNWSSAVPVSPAVRVGQLLFVSGQTARDVSGVDGQTRRALEKLRAILVAGGADYSTVVKCGVYLSDTAAFEEMNEVYRQVFPKEPPARTTIFCALAYPDVLVEIDCVAEVIATGP